MSNATHSVAVNLNWVGLLGVLFVGLKLGHVIDWSWWWVTCPFWGGLAFVVALFVIALVFGGLAHLFTRPKRTRYSRERW